MAPDRPALSRERILRAALALADSDGADAVTMRRLADRLGVEAMSLYHHVPSKQALLDGLVELVLGEARVPDAGDWREALAGWARAFRRVAHEHPAVVRLFATHALDAPAWATAVEDLLAALRAGGLEDERAVHAYRLVATFATGYVLYELRQTEQPTLAHYLDQLDPATHPATHALAPALATVDRDAEYELGLGALLAGVNPRRPRSPAPRRPSGAR